MQRWGEGVRVLSVQTLLERQSVSQGPRDRERTENRQTSRVAPEFSPTGTTSDLDRPCELVQ